MKLRINVLIVLFFALVLCVSLPVMAATIYVDDDSTCTTGCGSSESPYAVIQDGVNAAAAGDTVQVAAGNYSENVTIPTPLTLQTDEAAVITAANTVSPAVDLQADNVTVSGFTITGATLSSGVRVWTYDNGVISDNIISNNKYGVSLPYSSGTAFDLITIADNEITNNEYGFYNIKYVGTFIVTGNDFSGNVQAAYIDTTFSYTVPEGQIYNNNFYDTSMTIVDPSSHITWHNGYTGGGNYWSDWTSPDSFSGPNQDIPGADGYVDVPRGDDMYPFVMADGWNDRDGDGYLVSVDCDDNDPAVYPGAPETKHDGIDQDCNGYDLTIDITKANYDSLQDSLRIEATSSLNEGANLTYEGQAMSWHSTQQHWAITIEPAGGNPGTVTVCGFEGCESAPVIVE